MIPIPFKEQNTVAVGPKGSDILPLPALNDGQATYTRWALDDDDRARIAAGGDVWLMVHSGPRTPPVYLATEKPFPDCTHADSYAIVMYGPSLNIGGGINDCIAVYNARNLQAPSFLKIAGRQYKRMVDIPPVFQPAVKLEAGEWCIRAAVGEEETPLGEWVLAKVVDATTWKAYTLG